MIGAAEVVGNLSAVADNIPAPANESQARPLTFAHIAPACLSVRLLCVPTTPDSAVTAPRSGCALHAERITQRIVDPLYALNALRSNDCSDRCHNRDITLPPFARVEQ